MTRRNKLLVAVGVAVFVGWQALYLKPTPEEVDAAGRKSRRIGPHSGLLHSDDLFNHAGDPAKYPKPEGRRRELFHDDHGQ